MMRKLVQAWYIGRIAYEPAMDLQDYISANLKTAVLQNTSSSINSDTLLLLEHPPTYTVGIRNAQYSFEEEEKLRALGADFHRTNRGGLITFHGPGQLIVYPILYLKNYRPAGVRCYVERLEESIIQLCHMLNIEANRSPHTGVWVKDNKVCAIGIHASRHVTSHGLALNCNTDLQWYNHIVPCGIEDKGITSLSQELQRDVTVSEIIPKFLHSFASVFESEVRLMEEDATESFKLLLKEKDAFRACYKK